MIHSLDYAGHLAADKLKNLCVLVCARVVNFLRARDQFVWRNIQRTGNQKNLAELYVLNAALKFCYCDA